MRGSIETKKIVKRERVLGESQRRRKWNNWWHEITQVGEQENQYGAGTRGGKKKEMKLGQKHMDGNTT